MKTKAFLSIILLFAVTLSFAQTKKSVQVKNLEWGVEYTLTGKVVIMDLINPHGRKMKDCLVFMLDNYIHLPSGEDGYSMETTTNKIRIYGDLLKEDNPLKKYASIINKRVRITGKISPPGSSQYPLDANYTEDIKFKVIN